MQKLKLQSSGYGTLQTTFPVIKAGCQCNVYRYFRVLYREIRVRGFQIYGDCMLPTIPAIIICKVKKFPNNFCGSFRLPVIPIKFICMLQGTLCDTGISYTFYRGKICSAVYSFQPKEAANERNRKPLLTYLHLAFC